MISIFSVFFLVSVILVLLGFKPLCTINHYIQDQYISDSCKDKFKYTVISSYSFYEYSCPENDLAQIVRTSYDLVKTFGCNHIHSNFFLGTFLNICKRFK